jgi:DNA-binding beta-propeller fold protein YncE
MDNWAARERAILNDGSFTFAWAHSIAAHPVTGKLYFRIQTSGNLIEIDPITREATKFADLPASSDSYQVFDPKNPNIMYLAYHQLNYIGKFDFETKTHTVFAGRNGEAGWMDGSLTNARFRPPNQLIVAPNGNLYVADRGNHCIRMIVLDAEGGGMVSTVIGKGGVAGYQDGNPEDALFNNPRGVAVLPDGTIYITDYENNVVRKLTVE